MKVGDSKYSDPLTLIKYHKNDNFTAPIVCTPISVDSNKTVSFTIVIAQRVFIGYRSIIHFIKCEYKVSDAAPTIKLLGSRMLMYNRDKYNSKIGLYPLLEGASVSGVILKYSHDELGDFYIKVKNTSLAYYSIKSHLICHGISDTIEATGKDLKFKSVFTYFTQTYLD